MSLRFADAEAAADSIGYLSDSSPVAVEIVEIDRGKPVDSRSVGSVLDTNWKSGDQTVAEVLASIN